MLRSLLQGTKTDITLFVVDWLLPKHLNYQTRIGPWGIIFGSLIILFEIRRRLSLTISIESKQISTSHMRDHKVYQPKFNHDRIT